MPGAAADSATLPRGACQYAVVADKRLPRDADAAMLLLTPLIRCHARSRHDMLRHDMPYCHLLLAVIMMPFCRFIR